MLIEPFIDYRKRPRRTPRATAIPPPPRGPVLVSAVYEPGTLRLEMVFDRAVAFDDYDGTAINVNDPVFNNIFLMGLNGHTLLNPTTVRIGLTDLMSPSGTAVTLRVAADVGIVAVDGGIAWDGTVSVPLPYP
jgi:hypothetical protein